jgi:light-regulated signal transduction histidine kinase (bacteriophytochrome)
MTSPVAAAAEADLLQCAAEPIHIPGAIQPHGVLLVLDPGSLTIVQAAVGAPSFGTAPDELLGRPLRAILPASAHALVETLAERVPADGPVFLGALDLNGPEAPGFNAVAHRSDGAIVLELEERAEQEPHTFEELYPSLRDLLAQIETSSTVEELCALGAREVRRITGLDRVLIYRFDPDWNGEVIGESRNEALPSYLGLRFPASDIPAQARELYGLNRLRLISSADYVPAPIRPTLNPLTGRPIDLSFSVLRSVSPVHLEYMRNMGTGASMSVSLLRDGRLWGLISCHNREPHRVPYHVRTACDFVGQILSLQIASREHAASAERRSALRAIQARLLAHMASEDDFRAGLVDHPDALLGLTGAAGAAVVSDQGVALVGDTPSQEEVEKIAAWLRGSAGDLFSTDSLNTEMPDSGRLIGRASGLLAISISKLHPSYVLWFRPEVVQTVRWGGDPTKPVRVEADGPPRLHPRKSFEIWRETVSGRSEAWDPTQVDAANELRTAIVDIVLRNAEETAALSEELSRSNKELEAFSYSVSHDLRAPFRHVVGYAELLKLNEGSALTERAHRYIDTIIEAAVSAGTLVDNLLSFSQLGRATLQRAAVDMDAVVSEVRPRIELSQPGRRIEWRIQPLPAAYGDRSMLAAIFQNLLENAVKFTRDRETAEIEVGAQPREHETVYWVADNGAGFDMTYADKMFGVFQRLHRIEDFPGTGIGLANVKRIVERHGGRVWAEGEVDRGAKVLFALPNRASEA